MTRVYSCISQSRFTEGDYSLTAIRDEDKYLIMQWRNEQIDILRQKEPLTLEQQESYFIKVVDQLFRQEKPAQLLFSFFKNDKLIGYGGLVHIDWDSLNAEISFITQTSRNSNAEEFIGDWSAYLTIIKRIAEFHLGFVKIYTYAYDIRDNLFTALDRNGFAEEARLKNHIRIGDAWHDVRIHSFFFPILNLRMATSNDMLQYFTWANDDTVRKNSFNSAEITLEEHQNWFTKKISSKSAMLFVAILDGQPVGQIRFDEVSSGVYEIDFSIDEGARGQNLGARILSSGKWMLMKHQPGARRIIGKVKRQNVQSGKAFLKAGFIHEASDHNNNFDIYYSDIFNR